MIKKSIFITLILIIVIFVFSLLFLKKDESINKNVSRQEDSSVITPYKINTFADFENSPFCKKFQCDEPGIGKTSDGNEFRKYMLPEEDVYIEVTVGGDKLYEINLAFWSYFDDGEKFNPEVIYDLLNSIDSELATSPEAKSAKEFIMKDIESSIYRGGDIFNWGPFFINAGKDGQGGWDPSLLIRREMSEVEIEDTQKVNCPEPYRKLTDDDRCLWKCYPGSTPGDNNECVCKPGYIEIGKDKSGRRICELKK